jgi:SAM-dependent methyltransferase
MEDIPFPAAVFDVVYMNVLDHVARLELLAAEVGRVVAEGGLFLGAVLGGGSTDEYSPAAAVTASDADLQRLAVTMTRHGGLQRVAATVTDFTIRDTGRDVHGRPRRAWPQRIYTQYFRRVSTAPQASSVAHVGNH